MTQFNIKFLQHTFLFHSLFITLSFFGSEKGQLRQLHVNKYILTVEQAQNNMNIALRDNPNAPSNTLIRRKYPQTLTIFNIDTPCFQIDFFKIDNNGKEINSCINDPYNIIHTKQIAEFFLADPHSTIKPILKFTHCIPQKIILALSPDGIVQLGDFIRVLQDKKTVKITNQNFDILARCQRIDIPVKLGKTLKDCSLYQKQLTFVNKNLQETPWIRHTYMGYQNYYSPILQELPDRGYSIEQEKPLLLTETLWQKYPSAQYITSLLFIPSAAQNIQFSVDEETIKSGDTLTICMLEEKQDHSIVITNQDGKTLITLLNKNYTAIFTIGNNGMHQ
jgi:hypothetical protein